MPSLPEAWRRLPTPVRFMACHAATGFGISALFVGALLLTNPGDAGTLLLTAADHWWPAAVLWFFIGLTFGSVQLGTAVMLLGERAEPPRPRGGSGAPVGLVPIRLRVRR
ncbi:hypothetical protein [Falsiroseomonas oryziterrae]|uniref:hypothetical protein n=1 Tax=Falsiroseomonas oryziterrae TaxID=2911368 RepID=UPI001F1A4456|nr:hypothetical protein [Roseomonas sp. NPKOSM-4]